ncbi:unannotated protein [freshwater metagenome]
MSENGHLDTKQRRADGRAEERLVALIFGVGDESDTRWNHLGSGRLDVNRSAVGRVERDAMICTGNFFVLEFRLGDRGTERDVPQGWRVGLIRLAAGQVSQEGALSGALGIVGNRAVRLRPVDREAESSPEFLELLFVFDGQLLAEFDKIATRNWHLIGRL